MVKWAHESHRAEGLWGRQEEEGALGASAQCSHHGKSLSDPWTVGRTMKLDFHLALLL